MRLHLTSGRIVAESLLASSLDGDVLSWRDRLHDGPVPGGLSLEELSEVRASFVAERCGRGSVDRVRRAFLARNTKLRESEEFDEVTLWFGHDLGDQLRLIQLLDWFGARDSGAGRLSMICIDRHPDVERFRGLVQLDSRQLAALDWIRHEVNVGQLELARRAWHAFTSERPDDLLRLSRDKCWSLPHLPAAIKRHLQQFPGLHDGLSRTERQILDHVTRRGGTIREAYQVTQLEQEEVPFMERSTFLCYIDELLGEPLRLLELGRGFRADRWSYDLRITKRGSEILAGREDRVCDDAGDRWLGGVLLRGVEPAWRWDPIKETLVSTEVSSCFK